MFSVYGTDGDWVRYDDYVAAVKEAIAATRNEVQ
jgi:hypothetical protein